MRLSFELIYPPWRNNSHFLGHSGFPYFEEVTWFGMPGYIYL